MSTTIALTAGQTVGTAQTLAVPTLVAQVVGKTDKPVRLEASHNGTDWGRVAHALDIGSSLHGSVISGLMLPSGFQVRLAADQPLANTVTAVLA